MLEPSALHGILPPIVTPLTSDGEVDHRSLTSACRFLLASGVHGIWAAGTTGEFPCFTAGERAEIVQTCVAAAGGRVPVVANVGDCSTKLAVDHARRAAAASADALALTPPYYYLNSQGELMDHFRAVRTAVDLPLLVYNIPQTVKTQFEVATVLSLAEEGTVVGMKDSQNDLDWDRTLIAGLRERDVPFRLFLGTRSLIDAGILLGACGAIPGTANVTPAWSVATYEAAARGRLCHRCTVAGASAHRAPAPEPRHRRLRKCELHRQHQARAQGPGCDRARHHGRAPPLAKRR